MVTYGVDTKVVRGEHRWVKEHREATPPKPRALWKLYGCGPNIKWGAHNNSFNNLRRGLMERVYYVERNGALAACPQPKEGVFKELFKKVGWKLVRLTGQHSPIGRQDLPALYQGRKRTIYQAAADSLEQIPLLYRDSKLKTFVKFEKLNFSKKPDPAPRVIQPRAPRYNVELGKYLKPFEHKAYRALDKMWGGPTVMKGYTVGEIGNIIKDAWSEFRKPVAIGFDMSRFDQHVSVDALKFEHRYYLSCFAQAGELRDLLRLQLLNEGVGYAKDGWISYKVDGKRMSGDMNTALGNCILACCITKYITDSLGIKARLINNGDDCVLLTETKHCRAVEDSLTKGWLDFGFTCIAEPAVYEIEKIEFCQMKPILIGDGYVMVRNPRVSLSKDCHSTVPFDSIQLAREWAYSVGEGGLALAQGVPVVQEFYMALRRNGRQHTSKRKRALFLGDYYQKWVDKHRGGYSEVSEDTRHSFHIAFGISPDQQIALESEYKKLELLWDFAPYTDIEQNPIEWTLQSKIQI